MQGDESLGNEIGGDALHDLFASDHPIQPGGQSCPLAGGIGKRRDLRRRRHARLTRYASDEAIALARDILDIAGTGLAIAEAPCAASSCEP